MKSAILLFTGSCDGLSRKCQAMAYTDSRTRTRKLFIWQVQVQSYNKSGKKHNIIEIYKYSQETEAKVQEYRYRQSHLLGHAVSWVDHRKRRWVLLVLVCYVRIKVHM